MDKTNKLKRAERKLTWLTLTYSFDLQPMLASAVSSQIRSECVKSSERSVTSFRSRLPKFENYEECVIFSKSTGHLNRRKKFDIQLVRALIALFLLFGIILSKVECLLWVFAKLIMFFDLYQYSLPTNLFL